MKRFWISTTLLWAILIIQAPPALSDDIGLVFAHDPAAPPALAANALLLVEQGVKREGLSVSRIDPVALQPTAPADSPPVPEWIEKAWLAYKYFNFDEATTHLDHAEEALLSWGDSPEALRKALFDIKVFQAMLSLVRQDRVGASKLLRKAADLGTAAWIDPLRFPPGVSTLFNAVAQEIEREATVPVHVVSEPGSATVIIDGKPMGETPLTVPLRSGLTYLFQLERDDTRPFVQRISLPLPENTLKAYLTPRQGSEMVASTVKEFFSQPTVSAVPFQRVAGLLGVNTVCMAKVESSGEHWRLAWALYREGKGIAIGDPIELSGADDQEEFGKNNPELERVVQRILQWHRGEKPPLAFASIIRKKWFWPTVVGVALTGAATPFVVDAFRQEVVTIRVEK
ncbi:MAG: PEGA domain-containing protein [Nitrospirae bacterium]|nr:PEGA domain-containing protein [Nitrospirota bacterium]